MKTEQEQIEQIEKVLKDSVVDYKHLKKKGVCYCYAKTLIDKGYGNVSEYKAEIERLKSDFKQLQTNAEILARGVRDFNHENYELTEKNKQAQLNILGKLWSNISNNKLLIQSHIADGSFTIEDIYMEIDELMAEVEKQ